MQLTRDNGSSPLTRGKPCLVRNRSPLGGLIPAHAGKTLLMPAHMPSMKGSSPLTRGKPSGQAGPAPPTPAHPRSRGENTASFFGSADILGSSPLTRGKLVGARRESTPGGLIPAHAGKTCGKWATLSGVPAHPRSRGENYAPPCGSDLMSGSSPLTRGKLSLTSRCHWDGGLIPAHAGKTSASTGRT